MNLWIRSQDREQLIKVERLKLEAKGDIDDCSWCICTVDYRYNYDYYFGALGEYKTKERALEVLDEIQNAILSIYADNKQIKYTGMAMMSTNTKQVVYGMPKE